MPLTIYRRGKIWHYRGHVAGRRLRGSTGSANKEVAQQVAASIESKQWKGHLNGPSAVLTFAQAAILYRKAGKPTRFLDKVEDYWKDTIVKDITAGAIRAGAKTVYPRAMASTRNRQFIVATQAIINHAAESELCPHVRVKRFPIDRKLKEPVTIEWVKAFMAASTPHLGALALFMLLTGARVSEALAVGRDDLDLTKRTVLIKQTKLGNERRAHLPPPLVVALANIQEVKGRPLFWYEHRSNLVRAWRAACKRAGIKVLSPHSCRHGFATALLHKGIDPVTVAKLGGWKSPQHVFATYGHARDDLTLTDIISDTPVTQHQHRSTTKARKSGTSII